MLRVQKMRAAALGLIAVILLAGCSAGPDAGTSTPGQDHASTPDTQTQPEPRQVRGVEVIDPITVVVTPIKEDDEFFGEELVVHINDVVVPAEGECGFEEALELSTATVIDAPWSLDYSTVTDSVYIDDQGEHYGILNANVSPYSRTMVAAGMAHVPADAEHSYLTNSQADAEVAGVGLWATCSDFGA